MKVRHQAKRRMAAAWPCIKTHRLHREEGRQLLARFFAAVDGLDQPFARRFGFARPGSCSTPRAEVEFIGHEFTSFGADEFMQAVLYQPYRSASPRYLYESSDAPRKVAQ